MLFVRVSVSAIVNAYVHVYRFISVLFSFLFLCAVEKEIQKKISFLRMTRRMQIPVILIAPKGINATLLLCKNITIFFKFLMIVIQLSVKFHSFNGIQTTNNND